jgi:anti-anti-sigma factor
MEINEQQAENITILSLVGRLDSSSAPELEARLQASVAAAQAKLLLDLSGISYLSSAGFRALLIGARLTADAGGVLVLCGPIPPVRRLFQIAAFDEVLEIHGTQQDALAYLARET